jgi:hypothetical protein
LCGVRLSLSICNSEQMDSSNKIANKVLISLDNDLPF